MNSIYIPAIPDEDCTSRGHRFTSVQINKFETADCCENCSKAVDHLRPCARPLHVRHRGDGKTEVAIRAADRLLAEWCPMAERRGVRAFESRERADVRREGVRIPHHRKAQPSGGSAS